MWSYEKRLQYPVNIKNTNAEIAKIIISVVIILKFPPQKKNLKKKKNYALADSTR